MKALQITDYTGAGILRYQDADVPVPGEGQVAIEVTHAGANYVEALFAGGFVPDLAVPWTPGIEAVGYLLGNEPLEGLGKSGDLIAALTINGGGAYGQIAVTNAHLVKRIPAGLSPVVAAAVPSNTTTALLVIERLAKLRPGESVLVHAAAGGLGSQIGQVAKHCGAGRVVGVVGREEKRQHALDLGYDEVWLRSELDEHLDERFDVIADPVSGPARVLSIDLLAFEGRLLVVGDAAQAGDQCISSNSLWFGGKSVLGFNLGALAAARPKLVGEYLDRALHLVADGTIRVEVTATKSIQNGASVLEDLRSGTTIGKTVLSHERDS
ncbi:zinc-binding dehydrogenase [Arthrobacter sp. Y-9]|uniref:quinone oxidoreductase family protein n=1 Tax=Arthrobacter sp. Y-9 TaxID=3039385 RepID=UPI00241CFE64|nr:zinc-binding dehydrogenase [Arthrobacter sp. Y-9]WFR83461.1 zinc-binding dehydrogenase [Arthrobacter sp. Y-9]